MDAPPGSHCRVRGQGVERRRGPVTLGGASDGCQIRTLGAMGRDAGEDTGMETTAAQRLRSRLLLWTKPAVGKNYTHPEHSPSRVKNLGSGHRERLPIMSR